MKRGKRGRGRKSSPKLSLNLPDLDQAKSAVLNNLPSKESQRGYRHAIDEFVAWYCSEPRLSFNKAVVTRYRIHLESRQLAPGTIIHSRANVIARCSESCWVAGCAGKRRQNWRSQISNAGRSTGPSWTWSAKGGTSGPYPFRTGSEHNRFVACIRRSQRWPRVPLRLPCRQDLRKWRDRAGCVACRQGLRQEGSH